MDDLAGDVGGPSQNQNFDDDEDDFFGSSKKVTKKASALDQEDPLAFMAKAQQEKKIAKERKEKQEA